ncbi:MAG: hypothetical protein JRI80_20105 [Deltaproteobacteria bacterium]|nr:hypothetical protein [Deltaproteobacteria bacterium]
MTLFTRSLCSACQEVKRTFDLAALGVRVEELAPDNPEALAHLAWHELVETAEKTLPILVLNDSTAVTDVAQIKRVLEGMMTRH